MRREHRSFSAPARDGGRAALPRGGFSLLELIVVMAIISIIAGMIAPMFGASIGTVQFRNARNDFVALLQFTQELAVRDSREYRMYIDKKSGTYWVEALVSQDGPDKTFAPVKQSLGQKQTLPDYVEISELKARKDRGSRGEFIGCYPNGVSDEAEVTISDKRVRGRKERIEVSGPLGQVSVADKPNHVVTK